MDRNLAVDALRASLNEKWESAKKAFEVSHAGATSEQSKQEGKYDTRGLEESYLANGLSQSVREFQKAIVDFESCVKIQPKDEVGIGSLVSGERDGESVSFFLSYSGGGVEAEVEGEEVTIITPESPLAKQLMGKKVGDRAGALKIVEVG